MTPLFADIPSPELRRALKFRAVNPLCFALDLARETMSRAGAKPVHALLISDAMSYTSEEQLAPFDAQRAALRKELGLISMHLLLDDALRLGSALLSRFDVIFVKLGFLTSRAQAEGVVRQIADASRPAKIVYMDGDDDSAILWPGILPLVDLYVKKHVFRDRATYAKTFVGKSNLTDYVSRESGLSFAEDPIPHSLPVPAEQLSKVMLGYNIALDAKMTDLYAALFQRGATQDDRPNDIVSRATVSEDSWLFHLRKQLIAALQAMPSELEVLDPATRVPQGQYYQEMLSSKLCVSPFGYGEICWRDFEAVMCGCLLVKPDMSHIETSPDIFVAGETYVPVRWDYGDLAEQCARYLRDDEERSRIVANARRVLSDCYENGLFVHAIGSCLTALELR